MKKKRKIYILYIFSLFFFFLKKKEILCIFCMSYFFFHFFIFVLHEAIVQDTCRTGVWLGRHICYNETQVSQGQLRENRNLSLSIRAKAVLIYVLSVPVHKVILIVSQRIFFFLMFSFFFFFKKEGEWGELNVVFMCESTA
jgi:hypothetical protein